MTRKPLSSRAPGITSSCRATARSMRSRPAIPARSSTYSGRLARLFHDANPRVDVRLFATWSRADQTYSQSGHWFGKPIEAMADRRASGVRRGGRALAAHPRRDTGRRGLEPGHRGRLRGSQSLQGASAPARSIYGPRTVTMRARTVLPRSARDLRQHHRPRSAQPGTRGTGCGSTGDFPRSGARASAHCIRNAGRANKG